MGSLAGGEPSSRLIRTRGVKPLFLNNMTSRLKLALSSATILASVALWLGFRGAPDSADGLDELALGLTSGSPPSVLAIYDGSRRLPPDQVAALFEEVLHPKFRNLILIDKRVAKKSRENAVLEMEFDDGGGKRRALIISALDADRGGAVQLYSLLLKVWQMQVRSGHWRHMTPSEYAHALVTGIEADKEDLERIGIAGCFFGDRFLPWDEQLKIARKRWAEATGTAQLP